LDLRPKSHHGTLDVNVLEKHSCDANRVYEDCVFFYQLILLFCPPDMSDIVDDGQMPYFSHISMFTNVYASTSGGGIRMGHDWQSLTVPELVRWTPVPILELWTERRELSSHGGAIRIHGMMR
jgi:hypothetical protein